MNAVFLKPRVGDIFHIFSYMLVYAGVNRLGHGWKHVFWTVEVFSRSYKKSGWKNIDFSMRKFILKIFSEKF